VVIRVSREILFLISLVNFISYRALAKIIRISKENRVRAIVVIASLFYDKEISLER